VPANLTPIYKAAEARYKQAKSPEEKLDALEEMLRTIPKHKGTEKMCADIKSQISKTRDMILQARQSGRKGISYHIPKEGSAQCVLVGPPNAGKSSILAHFTNAPAVVADYAYSTVKPQPGILHYENLSFQIIDLPPVSKDFLESWMPSVIRVADLILLVAGLDDIFGLDCVLQRLQNPKTQFVCSFEEAEYQGHIAKIPALILATKLDHPDAETNLEMLTEIYGRFQIIPVSIMHPDDAHKLGSKIYSFLQLVRIYTQAPGKKPNMDQPIVLRRGSTVLDAARLIHKDFAASLKYARVWGTGKFDGQRVQRDYILEEGDIIEFKI
jgi:uncharacterized protein